MKENSNCNHSAPLSEEYGKSCRPRAKHYVTQVLMLPLGIWPGPSYNIINLSRYINPKIPLWHRECLILFNLWLMLRLTQAECLRSDIVDLDLVSRIPTSILTAHDDNFFVAVTVRNEIARHIDLTFTCIGMCKSHWRPRAPCVRRDVQYKRVIISLVGFVVRTSEHHEVGVVKEDATAFQPSSIFPLQ